MLDENGNFVDGETQRIHRDEFYADAWESVANKATDENAGHIYDGMRRKDFVNRTKGAQTDAAHATRLKANDRLIKRLNAERLADIDTAVASGQYDMARDLASQFKGSNEERKDMLNAIQQEEQLSVFRNILNQPAETEEQVVLQEAVAEELLKDSADSGINLPEEVRQKMSRAIQAKAEDNFLNIKTQNAEQEYTNFRQDDLDIERNPTVWTEDEIRAREAGGAYGRPESKESQDRMFDLIRRRDAALASREKQMQADYHYINGGKVDYTAGKKDPDSEASANLYYNSRLSYIQQDVASGKITPQEAAAQQKELDVYAIQSMNLLPENIGKRIRAANTGDAEDIVWAGEMINYIQELNPQLVNYADMRFTEDATAMAGSLAAGVPAEQAARGIIANRDRSPQEKEAVAKTFQTLTEGADAEFNETAMVALQDFFDDGDLTADATAMNFLKTHFKNALAFNPNNTEAALQTAVRTLAQGGWGVETSNGSSQLSYAPTNLDSKQLRRAVRSDNRQLWDQVRSLPAYSGDDTVVGLMTSPSVAGGEPVYLPYIQNSDGGILYLQAMKDPSAQLRIAEKARTESEFLQAKQRAKESVEEKAKRVNPLKGIADKPIKQVNLGEAYGDAVRLATTPQRASLEAVGGAADFVKDALGNASDRYVESLKGDK